MCHLILLSLFKFFKKAMLTIPMEWTDETALLNLSHLYILLYLENKIDSFLIFFCKNFNRSPNKQGGNLLNKYHIMLYANQNYLRI